MFFSLISNPYISQFSQSLVSPTARKGRVRSAAEGPNTFGIDFVAKYNNIIMKNIIIEHFFLASTSRFFRHALIPFWGP